MLELDDEQGVSIQFALWGYALTGDMLETAALVAEGHPELVPGMGAWDKTGELLTSFERDIVEEDAADWEGRLFYRMTPDGQIERRIIPSQD